MVYLTTSSTYDALLANNQARAYYLAEAGGRYAISQMLNDRNTAFTNLNGNTFTLHPSGFGDKFMISDMDINNVPMTVKSTGIVNEGSWLEGRRRLIYGLQKTTDSTSFDDLEGWCILDNDFASIFCEEKVDFDCAIRLKQMGFDFKIVVAWCWQNNQPAAPNLTDARFENGGLLSYEAQVKIKLIQQGANDGFHYMMGISFRLDTEGTATVSDDDSYGISFFRSEPTVAPPSHPQSSNWHEQLDTSFSDVFT
jgi:hypothetical protein